MSIALSTSDASSHGNFSLGQDDEFRSYYEALGYAVILGLIPESICDAARSAFDHEVRPYQGLLYRQTSGIPERNIWTDRGFLLNPILNVQSVPRALSGFRNAALQILTHERLQQAARKLLGDRPKLVQSMFFEANTATRAHQDTYYLDAETGAMTACWFALEDIAPGAGRFYICPTSHKIDLVKNGGDFDIAYQHDRYMKLVRQIIAEKQLECRAPALRKGDVLFWNSRTIHGSLPTTQQEYSRLSFTAHYIPDGSRFLQYQSRIKPLTLETVNGMRVHKPKDLNKASSRAMMWIETTFPKTFRSVRRAAIKAVTR